MCQPNAVAVCGSWHTSLWIIGVHELKQLYYLGAREVSYHGSVDSLPSHVFQLNICVIKKIVLSR